MYKLDTFSINTYPHAFYIVHNGGGCAFESNRLFIKESNDNAYLISGNLDVPVVSYTQQVVVEEDVIPIITAFPTGVHAYVGILSILLNYFDNKVLLQGKKLLLYKNTQAGILEIINHLVSEKKLNESDILYADPEVLYQFKSVTLIPNTLHSYFEDETIRDSISDFVSDYLKEEKPTSLDNISILKHFGSGVTSNMGAIEYEVAKAFSHSMGYWLVEPKEVGELKVINYLSNATRVLFSWGTTFMKNFVYVSDTCTKIDVLVFGSSFRYEYDNAVSRGILPHTFKNATIHYHLDFDLTTLTI